MPLRALIDGTEYLAPQLSSKSWNFLKQRVRSHESTLLLPCCRSRGFLRTSSRGLFHFVHAPRSTCVHRHESPLTLGISTKILRAAAELKYSATADVEVAGVHLPVLITIPGKSSKLAFLGYERKYSFKKIPALHAKLLENKVRPCWLVFDRILTDIDRSGKNGPLLGEIPCFLIKNSGSRVSIPGRADQSFDTFLTGLLHGDIHYRAGYRAASPEKVSGLLYIMPCPSCGREVYFYYLSGSHNSVCGVQLYPLDQDRYRPEVLAAFREEMRSKKLPFGHVEWGAGENKTPQAAVLECVHCGKSIYESRIRSFLRRQKPPAIDRISFVIRWKEPLTVPHPHWCISTDSNLC
jgi:hypothetical protein